MKQLKITSSFFHHKNTFELTQGTQKLKNIFKKTTIIHNRRFHQLPLPPFPDEMETGLLTKKLSTSSFQTNLVESSQRGITMNSRDSKNYNSMKENKTFRFAPREPQRNRFLYKKSLPLSKQNITYYFTLYLLLYERVFM